MSRKFVRNITGTNLGGSKLNKNEDKIEPFDTNVQNDILNDNEDIFIRQEKSDKVDNGYICLTDNIKNITSGNDVTEVEHTDKNEMHIETKETIITSKPDLIKVDKKGTNNYELEVPKADKNEAEKGVSNSKSMTPLQTKNAIEYNNVNVIPDLVKENETETEIKSKNKKLKVNKVSKNNFEVDLLNNNLIGTNLTIADENEAAVLRLSSIKDLDYLVVYPYKDNTSLEIVKDETENNAKQFKYIIHGSNEEEDLIVNFKDGVFKNFDFGTRNYLVSYDKKLILDIFKFGQDYYLMNVIQEFVEGPK